MTEYFETLSGPFLAQYIDHTLLRPDATEAEVDTLVREAIQHNFRSICIEKKWLPVVVPHLEASPVMPITVISFPQGSDPTTKKCEEVYAAVHAGAAEIDMVLNREWLKDKNYEAVYDDIRAVVDAAAGAPVKVILETSELTREEKIIACALAKTARASFVKTSTGFASGGATVEDVKLMRAVVGNSLGVKASGGIRNYQDAVNMIRAGANRLGMSASVSVMEEATKQGV